MKKMLTFLAGLLCIIWLCPAAAQNPFLTPMPQDRRDAVREGDEPRQEQPVAVRPGTATPRFQPPFLAKILTMQRILRQKMTEYARQIQDRPLGAATWQLMFFSLLYGIIHALGPGHGKSLVCSYFLSRQGTMGQALAFGNLITGIHILSAVVIVLGLSWFVGSSNIVAFHGVEGRLESVSYVLIMGIGLFLLGRTLYEWWKTPEDGHEESSRASTRDMLSLALASGLMPCPGAALILLFTLSLGVFWAGLLAMVPLALGMGLTASFLGMLTVKSTDFALELSKKSRRTFLLVHRTLACLGALVIILLGAGLYYGARLS